MQLQVHEPGDDYSQDVDSGGDDRQDRPPGQPGPPRGRREDVAPRFAGNDASNIEVSRDEPIVSPPVARSAIKRGIDLIGAGVGLVLASPVLLLAMAAIRCFDGGPALYKQTREGYRGQPFTIVKLRTMVVGAEHSQADLRDQNLRDGPAFKIARDPRVTPIGHFLRRTCLDELPQLWNVLRGEMSLVGPRPLPWHESRACDRWHRRRLDVRPGLTCDWQIDKSRAETFDDWMRLDLQYVDHADC